MTAPAALRVRALSIHAGYRCRNMGVCCSSGWDIPVEPQVERHLRDALRSRALRVAEAAVSSTVPDPELPRSAACFRRVTGLPHGASFVLACDSSGRCVFLDRDRRCAVHRQLGIEALPSACRDFPRVVTLTPLGVSITLSHYCPTAAAMLFTPVILSDARRPGPSIVRDSRPPDSGLPGREGSAIAILESPAGFPPSWPYEGLDARDALPPLLRPGVFMDWPSLERWETFAVSVLGREARGPEAALDVLAATAEEARRWTPEDGGFEGYFRRVLEQALEADWREAGPAFHEAWRIGLRDPRDPADGGSRGWQLVADCIPHRALLPSVPAGLDEADERWIAPAWPSLGAPIRRWLAAKAFASWLALQGEGLRTTVLGLRVALDVLRAESARSCAEAGRALDAALLEKAVQRTDLLLVHLTDPAALARRLSRNERQRCLHEAHETPESR